VDGVAEDDDESSGRKVTAGLRKPVSGGEAVEMIGDAAESAGRNVVDGTTPGLRKPVSGGAALDVIGDGPDGAVLSAGMNVVDGAGPLTAGAARTGAAGAGTGTGSGAGGGACGGAVWVSSVAMNVEGGVGGGSDSELIWSVAPLLN